MIGGKMEHCAATGVGTQEPTVVGKQVDITGYRLTIGVAFGQRHIISIVLMSSYAALVISFVYKPQMSV